jgi:hypothetical protein
MSMSFAIAGDRLAELRNKKKIAVQALDFDAAEEFDRQLKEENERLTSDHIDRIYSEILKDVQDQIAKYDEMRSDITQFQEKEEAHVNATYQDLFNKAEMQHEKELRDVDKSHGIALLRESEREIPAQLSLLEQAKAAAILGRFTDARQLRAEAREAGLGELEARRHRTDQEFSQSRLMLSDAQGETMAKLRQKYDEEMNNLHEQVRARRIKARERFNGRVDLLRQRAAVRCQGISASDDLREEALSTLNAKIHEMVRNMNPAASSPPSAASPSRSSAVSSTTSSTRLTRSPGGNGSRAASGHTSQLNMAPLTTPC